MFRRYGDFVVFCISLIIFRFIQRQYGSYKLEYSIWKNPRRYRKTANMNIGGGGVPMRSAGDFILSL